MKKKIHIEVVADILCPWCFIGKARLEKAMALVEDKYDFEYTWGPFQLYPNIPPGGLEKKELTMWRPFPRGLANTLKQEAAMEEIDLNYRKVTRIPNTLEAHRLLFLAQTTGKQFELARLIFQAYLQQGGDVEDHALLAALAGQINLPEEIIERFQSSDEGLIEVQTAIESYRDRGIFGVPAFIFNNKRLLTGAQMPETFVKYFENTVS